MHKPEFVTPKPDGCSCGSAYHRTGSKLCAVNAFDADREERWSAGCALGEAVWLRLCAAAGQDPKDEKLMHAHGAIVEGVREAFFAMEGDGFDGLAEWLDMESWLEMKGEG